MEIINKTLESASLAAPANFLNLTVFPLRGQGGYVRDYLTLRDAVEHGEVCGGRGSPSLKRRESGSWMDRKLCGVSARTVRPQIRVRRRFQAAICDVVAGPPPLHYAARAASSRSKACGQNDSWAAGTDD